MKKAVIAFVLTFIILSSKLIYSHGFGTHAAHYSAILALNDQYKALIEDPRYKPYFIYGSIFPDIQYAANYKSTLLELYQKIEDINGVEGLTYEILVDQIPDVSTTPYPFGIDTHNDKYGMAFAEYLLQQCNPIDPPGPNPSSNGTTIAHDARNMKLAFALGYYAHLAEDVAAHDFLIPKLTAALNFGDIELIKNSQSFSEDPNAQTEGIIEGIIDHYYGDNNLIADVIYNHVWVNRSQLEPTIAQMDFATGYAHLLYSVGPVPTYYDAQGGWPEMNPVLLFFNAVLNDWYYNNPFGLPSFGEDAYRKNNPPMSATGLNQLATVFRFVNRFYPAVAGHSFNGYDRLDQVLADWIANHLDYTPGVDILIIFGQVVTMFDVFDIRSLIFEGIAYPDALAETNASLADDARSLVSLMLADINEADQLVSSKPDLVNINEYNKLKNSVLFTNPTSVLNSYWNEYKNLGTMVYNEVGPVEGKPSRWYYEWSPWHSHSMAWGALSSLNNLIPDIYATNPNVAVYDAYFEVNQRRITGPEPAVTFQNNPNVKVVVELYNTSNVSSESLTLRVKKDHSSSNYSSDVLKSSTSFTLDHDPLTYNSTARKKVELSFPVSLSDLSGYKGYYFELVNNSNNKVMFSSSFEQYQERLDLTPNYTRLYGTYDEGKWPVSLGLLQSVATVNLTTPQFDGTAGGYYKINGIPQSSIIGYVDDYINMEAVPSTGAIFWKWSDGNTENPRTYRIPSTTVNLYAFYKSVNASNNTLAFGTNSQKKLVRTTDGRLHKVYSSMNMIWYEMSTDNGATWTVQNNGQPLSSNEAKLPAIDYYGNSYIFITWQEKYNYYGFETFKIRLAYISFPEAHLAFCDVFNASIYDPSPISPYSYDAMPVVAWGNGNVILIAWKLNEICYRYGYLNNYTPITWYTSAYGAFISGTNANSTNPTIAVRKDGGTSVFHLAWQHSITAIKYRSLTPNGSSLSISAEETPSSGDGFNYNVSPSISISSSGYPTLVWIGSIYQSATTQVTKRSKTYSGWSSTFGKYGSNVNSPTEYNSIIVWSEGNVNMLYRPWSSIRTLSTVGKYVQLSYWGSMYAVAHRQYSPYDFQTSPNVISIPKENTVVNKCGREVIIRRGDTEFYFTLADVIVNNEVIKFTEVEDTSTFVNINRVNQYFVTNSFSLYETSNLSFSIAFGTTDSVQATTELKNRSSIQFKLELVDANTNVVLSLIDNVKVGLENIYRYKEQSYKANTDGIVKRFVKFVVNVNTDFEDGSYYIADIFNETDILGKTNLEEIKLTVQPTVTTYGLYQNYPNPFNPTTKIKYQIPEDGIVSLKIYDILGKEVRTLVNEQKTMGRYEVKFDASDLASGVYIYRLNVNDFVSVKKMLLVK